MKSFASDNYSGICPEIFQAIQQANQEHVSSYGNDPFTQRALSLLKQTFGENSAAYFVYNGTAANTLALKSLLHSHQAIISTDSAHIATQEVGAVTGFTGSSLITVPHQQGKITPQAIEQAYLNTIYWGRHSVKPRIVSISQTTEFGTFYSIEELKAISQVCKKYQLLLHMDGSRLANAAAALNTSLPMLTIDCGVDVFSLGGTKNGLLFGEVIVFADQSLANEFEYIQKQGLQLHSKMRFLSAQFIPYLEQAIWQRNAQHANNMCQRLAQGLSQLAGVDFAFPVQSNQIFCYLPQAVIDKTQAVFPYYLWNDKSRLARLVTSFDTSEAEVDQFIELAHKAVW